MVFWKVGRVFCALYLAALVMLRFTRIQEKTAEIQLEKNFPRISKVLQQQASPLQPFWNPGRLKDQSSHSSASVPLASSRVGCSRAVRFSRSSFHKTREADLFRSERNPQPVNSQQIRLQVPSLLRLPRHQESNDLSSQQIIVQAIGRHHGLERHDLDSIASWMDLG